MSYLEFHFGRLSTWPTSFIACFRIWVLTLASCMPGGSEKTRDSKLARITDTSYCEHLVCWLGLVCEPSAHSERSSLAGIPMAYLVLCVISWSAKSPAIWSLDQQLLAGHATPTASCHYRTVPKSVRRHKDRTSKMGSTTCRDQLMASVRAVEGNTVCTYILDRELDQPLELAQASSNKVLKD